MLIKENKSILIPVDFSKQSNTAVKQSYNLAKFTKSKIVLLHVSPTGDNENADKLAALAAQTRTESGFIVETANVKGELYDIINKKAEELKSSMIIMGLNESANFKTGFLGGASPVSKFIGNAPCPVITIRSTDNREGCKNIVMPFDLSPESREKVSYAIQIAHYYKADIRIVSVFPPNDDEYENKLLPYLQQVKKFIKAEGVSCTNRSLPSTKPAEAIIEYALKNDCDLIIQINQQDLSISERFNGTVGHKVVELSPIPVLNVNPMKRESMSHFSSGM